MAVIDCVYFKRSLIYLIVRDWYRQRNIYFKRISYETIEEYLSSIKHLEEKGIIIDGIVIDGRRGLFQALSLKYPIQICQFHQKQIITRYLTTKPKTEAGVSLKEIVNKLTKMDETSFKTLLTSWYEKYQSFLKEKTINPITKRWFYTHKRLRSAYRSLKTNLPYLFTYQKIKNMPNTTNSLDGFFSHLKNSVSVHRGLKLKRKIKLIEYLIVR